MRGTREVFSETMAAEFLDVSVQWLRKMRSDGRGPAYHKVEHQIVRYLRSDLLEWVGKFRVDSKRVLGVKSGTKLSDLKDPNAPIIDDQKLVDKYELPF